jgi:hypothetical protein
MIVKNRPYFQQPELQARIRLPYLPPTRVHPIPPTLPAPPASSIASRGYDAYTLPYDENLFDDEDVADDESL